MPTAPPSIAAPPTPPARSDIATFVARADAWVAWEEVNAPLIGQASDATYANALEAAASATTAASAANGVGAALWVSGTSYSTGDVRRSPTNYYPYRRLTNGAGTTDPSSDTTNWTIAAAILPVLQDVTGTSVTAAAFNHYFLTNAGATTVTLPASPNAGDVVWVTVANGRIDNAIARNSLKIMGLSEDLALDNQYAAVCLRYLNATKGWWIV